MFYVRIGGALMAPFFGGWCIRELVLCDCVTWGGDIGIGIDKDVGTVA